MRTIKIQITGAPKTGKSAIAFTIGEILKNKGINFTIKGEDSNLLTMANTYTRRLEAIKEKTKVEIEMVYANNND